jgi:hypothetical protein
MSYELEAFKLGLAVGYILLWTILACIVLVWYDLKMTRWNRFLLETKQHQVFEEWNRKNKTTLKLIKG